MIALVVLYAAAVSAVLGAAAWLLEHASVAARQSVRWAWAGALAFAVALPVAAMARGAARPPAAAGTGDFVLPLLPTTVRTTRGEGRTFWTSLHLRVSAQVGRVPATLASPPGWTALDRPLAALWAAASALALGQLWRASRRARRLARGWARHEVGGGPVRVSADVGPAVFGALRPEVVVPAWALADPRLAVMLAHEREHLRARDPLLLAVAAVLAALTPWNPAVWWQLRRLRAAAELDCDRRVLAGRAVDPRAYGALLLDVAGRAPAAPPALALAAPPTLLRRRIEAMVLPRSKRLVARIVWPAPLAAGLVALACEVPRPTAPAAGTSAAAEARPATTGRANEPGVLETALTSALASTAPDLLTRRTGTLQRVWLLDSAGRIVRVVRPGAQEDAVVAFAPRPVTTVLVPAGAVGPDSLRVSVIRLAAAGSVVAVPESWTPGGSLAAPGRAPVGAVGPRGLVPLPSIRSGQDAPPLYVVDGKILAAAQNGAEPAGLPDERDIVSINVAKGPAAALRYGARARGGVVEMTTKAGAGPHVARAVAQSSRNDATPPLYVVEGRELRARDDSSLAAVEALHSAPERIASMNVLKGEAATRKYGARGRDGVIEITTKATAAKP